MNNTKRIVIAAIVVAAVVVGAIIYSLVVANKTSAPTVDHHDAGSHEEEGAKFTDSADIADTITYNGSSFSLSKSEVASGSNVKITNNSSEALNFDSDPHPTHTDNPELNAEDIAPHESKTITLTAKGKWGFHNHFNPTQHAYITVK